MIVNILGDVVKYFIATVLVAAFCVLLTAFVAAPLAVLVVGGIVAVGYIGFKLDEFEDDSGLHAELINIGRKCEDFLKRHKYDISQIGNHLARINSNGLLQPC
ncbi:MAG: hypothetical protein KAS93_05360 [Gammaproteobacteria bacterium]|nr:hypothetical protein [Gammaproteobacteria bacterium]